MATLTKVHTALLDNPSTDSCTTFCRWKSATLRRTQNPGTGRRLTCVSASSPRLCQHVATLRWLEGRIPTLKDKDYGRQALRKVRMHR